jgi:hypothetical protein
LAEKVLLKSLNQFSMKKTLTTQFLTHQNQKNGVGVHQIKPFLFQAAEFQAQPDKRVWFTKKKLWASALSGN